MDAFAASFIDSQGYPEMAAAGPKKPTVTQKHIVAALSEKHGMTNSGYWSPIDAKQAEEKLIYILAFPSKEAAAKSWKDFGNDPEWKKVREASEVDGKLVAKVESVYLNPTDYSKIK